MSVQIRTILGSKIRTWMCHHPDNFEPLAEVCASVRTISAGELKLIRSSVPPKHLFYYNFRCFLVCLCRIRTNSAIWLRSVSQSGQYCAVEIFLCLDNSRL